MEWADAIKEFIGFVALFLGAGAIGFRYFALRGWQIESDRPFYDDAARRAALLGLLGVAVTLITAAIGLPGVAARKHLAAGAFLMSDRATMMQFGFLPLAVIGYALAAMRLNAGLPIAAVGVVVGALRQGLLGQWSKLINPVHSLAAGLWIGTLFV